MFGLKYPHYRAAFIVAAVIECDILIILELFQVNLIEKKVPFVTLTIVWILLGMMYFVPRKRHERIIQRFKTETIKMRIIGSILATIFIFLSFGGLLFIKINQ